MKNLRFLLVVAMFASLSGCGGGSSGGGGAGFTGTFDGTIAGVLSAPGTGLAPLPVSGAIRIVVNTDGSVDGTVSDSGTAFSARGTRSGSTITIAVPGSSLNSPGLICSGVLTFTGTISGNTITGSFSGTIVCNGVTIIISGTFGATKTSEATLARGAANGIIQSIRNVVAQ